MMASSPILSTCNPSERRTSRPLGVTWWNAGVHPFASQCVRNTRAASRTESCGPIGSPSATATAPTRRNPTNARSSAEKTNDFSGRSWKCASPVVPYSWSTVATRSRSPRRWRTLPRTGLVSIVTPITRTAAPRTRTESMNQFACRVSGESVVGGRMNNRRSALSKARHSDVPSAISVSMK